MADRAFHVLGVVGGLCEAVVGVSHLWPLVQPHPSASSMLHVLTAWAMLPLGLLLAIRDAHTAHFVNAGSVLGTRFDAALDLLSTRSHFIIFLLWSGLACASFGGLYGFLGFLACVARAGTLLDPVKQAADKAMVALKEELQRRNINVPGFTEPPSEEPKDE